MVISDLYLVFLSTCWIWVYGYFGPLLGVCKYMLDAGLWLFWTSIWCFLSTYRIRVYGYFGPLFGVFKYMLDKGLWLFRKCFLRVNYILCTMH